ncbi:B3 domain-containing protein Os04g0386900-like [Impatiens glandulifera]|uniref:B3 domain-containing protein Os04g0386900-like n=1 Tax=Impatiens glandulifera TaxID=253017 RepID=UPI001FB171D4|nr:B3 domain-containing protein Os04g0386900-like [Impatiens glandulifera]
MQVHWLPYPRAGPVQQYRSIKEIMATKDAKKALLATLTVSAEMSSTQPLSGSMIPEIEKEPIIPLLGTPYFQVSITQRNLEPFYSLDVPEKMGPYLPNDNVYVILECLGNKWKIYYNGRNQATTRFIGLKIFAIYNNLKLGDVCLFELMDTSNESSIMFRVQILKEALPEVS